MSSSNFKHGVLAKFSVGGDEFKIWITNNDTIKQIFDLQQGRGFTTIPIGPILAGPGYNDHNAPWKWHLDPEKTKMAEVAMELCDGTPSQIEADLDRWINKVKSFCPWSAKLINVQDYR